MTEAIAIQIKKSFEAAGIARAIKETKRFKVNDIANTLKVDRSTLRDQMF